MTATQPIPVSAHRQPGCAGQIGTLTTMILEILSSRRIDIGTPALFFPAISLLMLAYTNRFLALARIVRDLADQLRRNDGHAPALRRQIRGIEVRLHLIKFMQAAGILALLGCLTSMFFLFVEIPVLGNLCFSGSMLLLGISLCCCLAEVLMAGNALRVVLETCRYQDDSPENPTP